MSDEKLIENVLEIVQNIQDKQEQNADSKFTVTIKAENAEEARIWMNATAAHAALWEISQKLRQWEKYGHTFKDADEAIEACRAMFWEEVNSENLKLD